MIDVQQAVGFVLIGAGLCLGVLWWWAKYVLGDSARRVEVTDEMVDRAARELFAEDYREPLRTAKGWDKDRLRRAARAALHAALDGEKR